MEIPLHHHSANGSFYPDCPRCHLEHHAGEVAAALADCVEILRNPHSTPWTASGERRRVVVAQAVAALSAAKVSGFSQASIKWHPARGY